ncbi:Ubiquinone/menaquinone biosynthesis C-methylase UbiE [Fodinibius roseus]|uniref:Ubiquinone/menaquinone biosynthesis C-methylase UbiE n=1 Tax=Fodinibius roseus TaxID=1194090 RepID=A0A1M4SLZ9_9BACT|nr:methyltransferase domain-containing protein [Fodinibius roseus]SHE33226.1 Ubiquinone/menaquinone biosynthesis C-methylase UbiE [Fodinibius roseus]
MSTNSEQNTGKKINKLQQQVATEETYSLKVPENYERYFVPVIGKPLAKELLAHASLQKGERVLDVACGSGIVARLASRKIGQTGSVTGLDMNPGMLAVARSTTQETGPITWRESGAEAMPFRDKTFDVALCQLGLQFMEDQSAALKEMQRVLVTGGRLTLNVPGPAGPVFAIFAEAMERHIGTRAAEFIHHVFSLDSTTRLRQLISKASFRNIEIHPRNKMLHLPAPKAFFWQYIHSTPLIDVVSGADKNARESLEQEVTSKWRDFVQDDGTLAYSQRIILASAVK